MAYVGNQPLTGIYAKLDNIQSSFNSSLVTFNLTNGGTAVTPGSNQNLFVSLNGVWQEPGVAYTITGSTITFDTAPAFGVDFFAILLGPVGTVMTVSDSSITSAKISGTIDVTHGGTGVATLTGIVKASGTSAFTAAVAGTDYLAPAAIGVTVQGYTANLAAWSALATSAKQDTLVSGTSIKTINGNSLLGSGDLVVGNSSKIFYAMGA